MTVEEIEFALKQMRELDAYSVRLFLDNGTTLLVHQWDEENLRDGLLGVVARGRKAVVAINRIILVEMVPPP